MVQGWSCRHRSGYAGHGDHGGQAEQSLFADQFADHRVTFRGLLEVQIPIPVADLGSEIFNHPMISEQINLWGTDEQASNQDSSEIHRDDIHDPKFNQSADMDNPGKDLMEKNASILRSIQQIANCDAGFVLSNNYLAVILANDFDPFEVKRKDIKKSDAFIDTIDAQAGWLQSIINEVKKTGWIS